MNPLPATAPTASGHSPVDAPSSRTARDVSLHRTLADWYAAHRRDLPWREPSCTPWGVLVSEVMLQQTPVSRVQPVWHEWLARWPTPSDLAVAPPAAAVAAWGRLGYPRRALRLHAAARACVERHEGTVPVTYEGLRSLPGVGDYTASAVAAFAFAQRHTVLDTNIRRVLARLVDGHEYEPPGAPRRDERERAQALLPADPAGSATWNAAVMELGATVCTARTPQCDRCPVQSSCTWLAAGRPAWDGPARRGQAWHGTDRQARGALMARVREAYVCEGGRPVTEHELVGAWPATPQRTRALAGLVADGLLEQAGASYSLPGAPAD